MMENTEFEGKMNSSSLTPRYYLPRFLVYFLQSVSNYLNFGVYLYEASFSHQSVFSLTSGPLHLLFPPSLPDTLLALREIRGVNECMFSRFWQVWGRLQHYEGKKFNIIPVLYRSKRHYTQMLNTKIVFFLYIFQNEAFSFLRISSSQEFQFLLADLPFP